MMIYRFEQADESLETARSLLDRAYYEAEKTLENARGFVIEI